MIVKLSPSNPTRPEFLALNTESSSSEEAIGVPIMIVSPDSTNGFRPVIVYSSTNSSELIIRTVRPSLVSIISTEPAISDKTADPLGDLASNNSSTLGRPLVMSDPATPPVWKVLIVS